MNEDGQELKARYISVISSQSEAKMTRSIQSIVSVSR